MTPAMLVLEDGAVFRGQAAGASGVACGLLACHSAMSGHQEILSDPASAGRLVAMTSVHVGNTGCNAADAEAARPQAAGLIARDIPRRPSSWRSEQSLPEWLRGAGVVAITGVDTRRLTRHLRARGPLRGCLVAGPGPDASEARRRAQAFALPGAPAPVAAAEPAAGDGALVAVLDLGAKRSLLRAFTDAGCRLRRHAADTPAATLLADAPAGVLLSDGGADPGTLPEVVETVRALLAAGTPVLGLGLGFQLLALALGGRVERAARGRHGVNHPVRASSDGRVSMSTQNSDFSVVADSLPELVEVTHLSLFDGSVQGLRQRAGKARGYQFQPEGRPGPHDLAPLLAAFIADVRDGVPQQGAAPPPR